jgi:hypothetical protein
VRVENERAGLEHRAYFKTEPDIPVIPTSVHWRLRCATNDVVLKDWTTAEPVIVNVDGVMTGVYAQIDVPGTLTGIINRKNLREIKELQVVAGKDTEREFSEEPLRWYVRRMDGRG